MTISTNKIFNFSTEILKYIWSFIISFETPKQKVFNKHNFYPHEEIILTSLNSKPFLFKGIVVDCKKNLLRIENKENKRLVCISLKKGTSINLLQYGKEYTFKI